MRNSNPTSRNALMLVAGLVAPPLLAANFQYSDFSSTAGLSLVGSATQNGNVLRLTPADYYQAGAAWYNTQVPVAGGFQTTFQFQFSDFGSLIADGITFTIQPGSAAALGSWGGDLGYGGIGNSLAVEFDTYNNGEFNDPNENHVGIDLNGSMEHSLGVATPSGLMADGSVHTARITYAGGNLSVFLDDLSTPLLNEPLNLGSLVSLNAGQAYVGLTGGTGAGYENQDILNWSFQSVPEPGQYALAAGLGLIGFAAYRRCRKS